MSGTSTSIHALNGDHRLSRVGKAAYFLLNLINNSFPYSRVDPRMTIRDFEPRRSVENCYDLQPGGSPSRTLCDLFWHALPWTKVRQQLGAVHVLDVGCGGGQYGPRVLRWSDGLVSAYVGIDIKRHEEWSVLEASDRRLRFYCSDTRNLREAIPDGTNVFISQSALEHIDEDLELFRQILDYTHATQRPVLQVHLVPSQACLWLYLLHGVRQYTPRTISRVSRLFGQDASTLLFRLGGSRCNRLHHEFITRPALIQRRRDRRDEEPVEYARRLREAIATDTSRPQRSPAFYALVIQSAGFAPIF